MAVTFVTSIDTDAGKSVATGLMARFLARSGRSVTTAKVAQTGATGLSPDIALHRALMGISPTAGDLEGATCPYLLPHPASPHLAARLAGIAIDPARIAQAVESLEGSCEEVLVEGVGGWLVPLTPALLLADFVASRGWPVIVVTSPRLGSINHTLLTLEAIRARGVGVLGGVYNLHPQADPAIVADTLKVVRSAFGGAPLVELPSVDLDKPAEVDFSPFFGGRR